MRGSFRKRDERIVGDLLGTLRRSLSKVGLMGEAPILEEAVMHQSPVTRPSLLIQVRDVRDRPAWDRFMEIYGPLVFAYGKRHGLQDADASDLVQEVLSVVASAAARFDYDPAQGSFRGWLLTITRNQVRRIVRRGIRQASAVGGTRNLARLAEWPTAAADGPREQDRRAWLFSRAARQVRGTFQGSTWAAFWKTAVEHQPVEAVAQELGISAGAVYIARSRVLARLREAIATIAEAEENVPSALSSRDRDSGEHV